MVDVTLSRVMTTTATPATTTRVVIRTNTRVTHASQCGDARGRSARARDATRFGVVKRERGARRDAMEAERSNARDSRWSARALALTLATLTTSVASNASAETLAVMEVALTQDGARVASAALAPLFAGSTILFIVRIVMTWYPSVPYTKFPWVIAYVPTEPLLKVTRAAVPPVGGVDVAPIIWVGAISFMNEILLGKQGLLVLLASKSMGNVG